MRLSNKTVYGIRALFDLAYHGEGSPLSIREIAERESIPSQFLGQIFQDLKRAQIVESKRGPKGGYVLAMGVEEITLGMVLKALDDAPSFTSPERASSDVQSDGVDGAQEPASWDAVDSVCQELMRGFAAQCDGFTLGDLMRRGEEMGISRACYERFVYVI